MTTDGMLFYVCLLRDALTGSLPCVSLIPRRQALIVEGYQGWAWKSWIPLAPRCATAHGGAMNKFSGSFDSHLAKIRKAQVAKYSRYICGTLVYTVLQPPQTWSHSSPGGEGGGGPLPPGLKDPKTDGEKAKYE